MVQPETPAATLPWRKRHPVLSRAILYALGLGIIAVLMHLYQARQAVDEQDRAQALAEELDALSLVHLMDRDGTLVLKLLDEKFMDPGLPVQVRARALRWRALALRKRPDPAPVEAALEAAAALDIAPDERSALKLEWAEARLARGDVEGALAVLPAQAVVAHLPPLALLRAVLHAQAEDQAGRASSGSAALEATLASLSAPLDPDVRVYVGGRDFTAAEVATIATEVLAAFDDAPLDGAVSLYGVNAARAYQRLVRLGPQDYGALIASTRAFLGLGLESDARAAWALARRADPRQASGDAKREPALAALGE